MAYPTLANLKTTLRITDTTADYSLQLSLDTAVDWVEDFTGRNFSGTNKVITDEEYDLDSLTQTSDGSFIQLRQMDIVSVQSVKLGDATLDVEEYKWTKEGRLIIFGRIFDVARRAYNDFQYVKVSYTYGTTTPKVIEGAVLMLAMSYWNDTLAMNSTTSSTGLGKDSSSDTVSEEDIGEYSVKYSGGNSSASNNANVLMGGSERSTGTINSVSRMLNSLRKRRV